MYFYQPSQGHGLPHDPLNAIIGPRPIGWIGSLVRLLQTGYIYHYALVMLVGVFALMTWFVWLHR